MIYNVFREYILICSSVLSYRTVMTVPAMGQLGYRSWAQWASPPTPALPHFPIPPTLTFSPPISPLHTSPFTPNHKTLIPMLTTPIA